MTACAAAAWLAVGLLVMKINPFDAEAPVIAVFFLTLTLAMTGTFAVAGFLLRIWLLNKTFLLSRQVVISVRQAGLLAFIVALGLFLESRSALAWWNVGLMVLAATIFEWFFIPAREKRG